MWYRIDMFKLAVQLLPPVLRCGLLIALLKALVTSVRYVYDKFMEYRASVSGRLDITAGVQYMEKALNDAFYLENRRIDIETLEADNTMYWYLEAEGQPETYMYGKGGNAVLLKKNGEVSNKDSFVVRVPSFLCTSLDASEDKYGGKYLREIRALIDYYKPAGRTYCIEIYDYE